MKAKTNPPARPPVALGLLVTLGLARLALHCLTNWQYGFHRDELGVLDDVGSCRRGEPLRSIPLLYCARSNAGPLYRYRAGKRHAVG